MTDLEFEILDELYFVKTFDELEKELGYPAIDLPLQLLNLIEKGWVRVIDEEDKEVTDTSSIFSDLKNHFRFIATKKGLMAHNQI